MIHSVLQTASRAPASSRRRGLTLIEMSIVIAIMGIFITLATPGVERFVIRSREAVLKQDLMVMRQAIDAYYADHREYPESLEILVDKRYFRSIPVDPFTRSSETWVLVPTEEDSGVFDVHSGSDLIGLNEEPYNAW